MGYYEEEILKSEEGIRKMWVSVQKRRTPDVVQCYGIGVKRNEYARDLKTGYIFA